jgi:diguanylate cyclase (GGDEF)-like protein/PAS domain S-box-containing protein
MVEGIQNVTGVEEFVDHAATFQLMLSLHPNTRKILVVVDSSLTGSEIKKTVEKAADSFKNRVQFEYYDQFRFGDIQGKMASLGPRDLIYLTVLNVDLSNRFISYKEGIDAITSSARVPVYGSWDFYLGKGIVGGMITSGFEQGKEAALMALRILNGENASTIPVRQKSRNGYMFDYPVLMKYGVPESRLPRGSVLINRPQNFFENTHDFMIGLAIVSLLAAMGFYLKNRKERKTTEDLRRLNEHLDSLVAEKTQKLNEINEKLSTMLNTMPSPVFFKDTKGVFMGCNKALADIVLGLPVQEIVGAGPNDLEGRIPKDLADFYAEKDRELIDNPGVQSYEAKVRCADGIRRDFLINKATLHNETGRVVGLVGVMMDISKRRQAEQERETLIAELHVANEKLEKLSVTDSLTGLSNRGHITKRIKEEIRKAERYKSTFSIIIVDLDRFKNINDTYGHLVGDLALQTVARVLRENIRDIDAVGRYGGEEFLVLLPNTDIDSGFQIAERIRKNIESMTWTDNVTITISGGIAEYNGESEEDLFRKADELLYRAKQGGRNRIEKMAS